MLLDGHPVDGNRVSIPRQHCCLLSALVIRNPSGTEVPSHERFGKVALHLNRLKYTLGTNRRCVTAAAARVCGPLIL